MDTEADEQATGSENVAETAKESCEEGNDVQPAAEEDMQHCDLFGELPGQGEEEPKSEKEGAEPLADTTEDDKTAEEDQQETTETTGEAANPESSNAAETTADTTGDEEQQGGGEKPAETTENKEDEGDKKADSDTDSQPGTKTNSDRQQDIFSRVFVGHLPTDRCTRNDVEKLFGEYGIITGCSVLSGYGFVQYKDPDSVDEAIRHLHGKLFHGAHIVVDKTDAARAALGEKPQKRPTPRKSNNNSGSSYDRHGSGGGGRGGGDQHYQGSRSHGYRDYGPPPYHQRNYGPPPPHYYDQRESYYPPRRGGGGGSGAPHYGYNRPRDDYYDRPCYDYHDY